MLLFTIHWNNACTCYFYTADKQIDLIFSPKVVIFPDSITNFHYRLIMHHCWLVACKYYIQLYLPHNSPDVNVMCATSLYIYAITHFLIVKIVVYIGVNWLYYVLEVAPVLAGIWGLEYIVHNNSLSQYSHPHLFTLLINEPLLTTCLPTDMYDN